MFCADRIGFDRRRLRHFVIAIARALHVTLLQSFRNATVVSRHPEPALP